MQLDYILVKERFKNQVKNCRNYPGTDIGSDHNPVIMTVELKFKKLQKKKSRCIDLGKLKTPRIKEVFEQKTDKILEKNNTNMTETIEDIWNKIKEGISKAAKDVLMKEHQNKRKTWLSDEVLKLIDERKKYKSATTDQGKQAYRRLKNEVIRKSRRDKENFLNEICEEIDIEFKVNNLDKAYGMVKQFFDEKKNKTCAIKDVRGELVYEEKQITKRWKEYLEKLYGDEDVVEVLERDDEIDQENNLVLMIYKLNYSKIVEKKQSPFSIK